MPKLPKRWDVCVVGAGLSGGVVAERLASVLDKSVLVIERRRHIAGNCYDYAEEETGLRINLYGPHNFHTNSEDAWKYINKFGRWVHYYHKKLSWSEDLGRFLPMPVNIETINTLYHENLMGEDEVKPFLESVSEPCGAQGCRNSEEQAIASVGKRMYERFFKGYTQKQWGRDPSELDASVAGRIPVRTSFDNRYFSDRYQAQPAHGYTKWMASVLSHANIDLVLGVDYFDVKKELGDRCGALVFTGPIDLYFASEGLPRLQYRSLNFEKLVIKDIGPGYYQPGTSVNYPGPEVPYTRSTEYKHYGPQRSNHTVVVRETSNADQEPYYPVPSQRNRELYA